MTEQELRERIARVSKDRPCECAPYRGGRLRARHFTFCPWYQASDFLELLGLMPLDDVILETKTVDDAGGQK